MKPLYIGNSFSVDILEHAVNVAQDLGIKDIKIGNLFYPACSLKMHLKHATEDAPNYTYYENSGNGWEEIQKVSIKTAMKRDDWDIIGIFHGTEHAGSDITENFFEGRSDQKHRNLRARHTFDTHGLDRRFLP